jgi:hypothetical protein
MLSGGMRPRSFSIAFPPLSIEFQLLAVYNLEPMPQSGYYFVSLANEMEFIGAVVLMAKSKKEAMRHAREFAGSPEPCEALATRIEPDKLHLIPTDCRDRLLSEEEARERLGARAACGGRTNENVLERVRVIAQNGLQDFCLRG